MAGASASCLGHQLVRSFQGLFQDAWPHQQMCFLLLRRCSLSHLFLAKVNCNIRLCDGLLHALPVWQAAGLM